MNQGQVKYARERAEAVFQARSAALKTKHTTPAVVLTDDEKLAALKAGKFTTDRKDTGSWQWRIRFTAEHETKVATALLDKEMAVLSAAYRNLTDELILGNSQEALQLLLAFEAG